MKKRKTIVALLLCALLTLVLAGCSGTPKIGDLTNKNQTYTEQYDIITKKFNENAEKLGSSIRLETPVEEKEYNRVYETNEYRIALHITPENLFDGFFNIKATTGEMTDEIYRIAASVMDSGLLTDTETWNTILENVKTTEDISPYYYNNGLQYKRYYKTYEVNYIETPPTAS